MNFAEAESYLYSLGNEVETMKLGLENIGTLLSALGNPQTNYLKVQVAGTNGKGSVCAFLDSICARAGIKTGLYTSPHLASITERIKVHGENLPEAEFAKHTTRVRETAEKLAAQGKLETVPTFFEQVTAIALSAFAEARIDFAILETGLGGRYDATTASGAEIAAITRIDLDHRQYLGDTIEKIAAEKAGIIRPDSRVVLMHQQRNVEQVLLGRCREVGVQPVWAAREIAVKRDRRDPGMKYYFIASLATEKREYCDILFFNMFGRHQIENAAVAIAIAEVLGSFGFFEIGEGSIIYGIEEAKHPGRLEYIDNFLLDGAHNVGAALALRAYLDDFSEKPITLVFGAMRDKDVSGIAEVLWPKADTLILTRPANSRAMRPEELVEFAPESVDATSILLTESVEEAITTAKRVGREKLIVVTGSLYLVGEARQLLS